LKKLIIDLKIYNQFLIIMYLFNTQTKRRLADEATENVRRYRAEQARRVSDAKSYLVSSSSVIYKKITDASKNGLLTTEINFDNLNKSSQFANFDYLFTSAELDQLIVCTTEFLEQNGLNHSVQGTTLIINWPAPTDDASVLFPKVDPPLTN
jgi:hypothetical protein